MRGLVEKRRGENKVKRAKRRVAAQRAHGQEERAARAAAARAGRHPPQQVLLVELEERAQRRALARRELGVASVGERTSASSSPSL